jgi:hypothetical protein
MTHVVAVKITCEAVPENLTVEQSHAIVQAHLGCATDSCRQRQAALTVLTDAGHYVLAAR